MINMINMINMILNLGKPMDSNKIYVINQIILQINHIKDFKRSMMLPITTKINLL
jgi:hypothetical protein